MKKYSLLTLYHPQETIVSNIQILRNQVDECFLIDNSENDNSSLFLNENVSYIPNYKNLGLSNAFNKVLKEISVDDCYIIFFDQDFIIEDNYIHKLISDYESFSNRFNIGCIGPVVYDVNALKISMSKQCSVKNKEIMIAPRLITSSLITKLSILKDIGYWDPKIFLDWADFDLCYRMRLKKYQCIVSTRTNFNHHLGGTSKRFLGIDLAEYNPIREYYQVRDALYLARKSTTPLKDRVGLIFNVIVIRFIRLLIFKDKKERLKYYLRAFKDFYLGKCGEYA